MKQGKCYVHLVAVLGQLHATGQAGDNCLEGRSAEEDLGVWVDSKWDRRKQCGLGIRNANSILVWISKITASREKEVTLPLYLGTASGLPCLVWGFPA